MKQVPFNELLGKTLKKITKRKTDLDGEYNHLTFITFSGEEYEMFHNQDCCESVHLEDITGQLDDLLVSPILQAEETSNRLTEGCPNDSCTWTFYKLATIKGYVTLRWLGSSNGYYSEAVSFYKTKEADAVLVEEPKEDEKAEGYKTFEDKYPRKNLKALADRVNLEGNQQIIAEVEKGILAAADKGEYFFRYTAKKKNYNWEVIEKYFKALDPKRDYSDFYFEWN